MNAKRCDCGTEIVFALTPNGKRIPLEKVIHAYLIEGEQAVPVTNLWQSHFIRCPKASEFSGRNRT